MAATIPDWSSLPDHLLASIAQHFRTRIDTLRFRAVCNSFRSSTPPPPKPLSPRADLKISIPPPFGGRGHLVLAEFTFYAFQPFTEISDPLQTTETWLVKIEELNAGKVRAEDPLSRRRLGSLSNKLPESEKLPNSLNLLDYRVNEVAKAYRLELVYQGKGISRRKPVIFRKAVVSSFDDETDDGFVVMVITQQAQLGVWRNVEKKWTTIDKRGYDSFDDLIYHKAKFYALIYTGLTITVDPKSLTVTQVAGPLHSSTMRSRSYLVESFQDLYLIVKGWAWTLEPVDFQVYKLDEERCDWVEVVDGLEDKVFFLGDDCSFSLSTKDFSGCKGNCVYFKDGPFEVAGCCPGTDGGIFGLKDGTVGGLSAFPGYSKIFWPRPTWMQLG